MDPATIVLILVSVLIFIIATFLIARFFDLNVSAFLGYILWLVALVIFFLMLPKSKRNILLS